MVVLAAAITSAPVSNRNSGAIGPRCRHRPGLGTVQIPSPRGGMLTPKLVSSCRESMGNGEISSYAGCERVRGGQAVTVDMDDAYANRKYIAGDADYPALWQAAAAAFRAGHGNSRLGLAYGSGARQKLDLFLPEGTPRGLMVFVHGGYWLAFDRSDWSHLAAGALARGWAVVMPGYTTAPEGRVGAMVREVAVAVALAARLVEGPIVVTGHSAGGHIAARLACADLALSFAARLRRIVPISPLSDLRPLMQTAMNAGLKLDMAEALAESPALLPRRAGADVRLWIGADERPAFFDQAGWLSRAWGVPLTVAPGQHHMDVIDGMKEPDSRLTTALLAGV